MRIGGSSGVYISGHTVHSNRPASSLFGGGDSDRLRTHLTRIDREVDDLSKLMAQIRGRGRTATNPFAVGASLSLEEGTSAVMTSRQEVNTEATSLSTRKPTWTGAGGRSLNVSGLWNQGTDDTLNFRVTDAQGRRLDVTNSKGQRVGMVNLNASGPTNVSAWGLTLTVGAGSVQQGDTFSFDVTSSRDGAIDVDDPFDGVGLATPRFEEGTTITAGSFRVNGTTISVATNDTVSSVLARITAQVDGVTASYDEATERVTLETSRTGTNAAIEITDDTSGLIAALKLDGLGRVTGTGGEDVTNTAMAQTTAFGGVSAGTLTVNGVDIAIDPDTQSLADVIAAIDQMEGVTAELDAEGRVVISGEDGATLSLDDTSGFLSAAGITAGIRKGREGTRSLSNFAAQRIAAEVGQLRSALDGLMDDDSLGADGARMKTELTGAIDEAMDEAGLGEFAAQLGLADFTKDQLGSRTRSLRTVRASYGDVREAMLGRPNRGETGLLDRLDDIIGDGLSRIDTFA